MSRVAQSLLAGAMVVALSGCVVASPDSDTYGDAARTTLGTAASEVATVQKLLELLDQHKVTRPAVVTQLRYSEESLGSASQWFGSLNQPSSRDPLEIKATAMLDQAASELGDARIAIRRHETSTYAAIASKLKVLAARLTALENTA